MKSSYLRQIHGFKGRPLFAVINSKINYKLAKLPIIVSSSVKQVVLKCLLN